MGSGWAGGGPQGWGRVLAESRVETRWLSRAGGRSAAPRAAAPVLLPSLHLPHFPSPLPPPTPQGSRFRFAVESLRGLIPSSVTLHPCGGAPLVYFLSPGCPHRPLLPSPTLLSRGRSALLTKPFLPQTTHLPISELPGGGGVYSRVLGQPFPGYSPPPSFPELSRISLPHSTSLPPPSQ